MLTDYSPNDEKKRYNKLNEYGKDTVFGGTELEASGFDKNFISGTGCAVPDHVVCGPWQHRGSHA
jgi:hypothetical protein